jgi:hypothetical protein
MDYGPEVVVTRSEGLGWKFWLIVTSVLVPLILVVGVFQLTEPPTGYKTAITDFKAQGYDVVGSSQTSAVVTIEDCRVFGYGIADSRVVLSSKHVPDAATIGQFAPALADRGCP